MLIAQKYTATHKKCFEAAKPNVSIDQFRTENTKSETDQLCNSEARIAEFFSEHHVPFIRVDHLLGVCKRAFPGSDNAKKLDFKKTKLSYIIQDGIARLEKIEVNDICRNQNFSVIIDESTDISVTQVLVIVVRDFDLKKLDVVGALLDTVAVENGSETQLFDEFVLILEERNIPFSNVIGFGSNNCFTMLGKKNRFQVTERCNPNSFCPWLRMSFICTLCKQCCVCSAYIFAGFTGDHYILFLSEQ